MYIALYTLPSDIQAKYNLMKMLDKKILYKHYGDYPDDDTQTIKSVSAKIEQDFNQIKDNITPEMIEELIKTNQDAIKKYEQNIKALQSML